MKMLTQKYLKKRLHYNPGTGIFTWLPRNINNFQDKGWNTKYAGKQAGYVQRPKNTLVNLRGLHNA